VSSFDFYQNIFPDLDPQSYVLTSAATPQYNCIAYAAGEVDRWWWPDPFQVYYWPPSAFRLENLAAFQQAFETLGYELCQNGDFELGYEKIAIYHKGGVPSHGARQLDDGHWTSKLGELNDILHGATCLDGQTYGSIAFFMRRSR
jgi:hypothetical protein